MLLLIYNGFICRICVTNETITFVKIDFRSVQLIYAKGDTFLQDTLTQAGLLIDKEKSLFQPVQCLKWLGLVWDSRLYSHSIPHRRIADTNDSIKFLIDRFPKFTARDLAKATGKIISMSPVVGNVTSLMTRHIYIAIESRIHWDLFISLLFPDAVKSELQFWLQSLRNLNQKRLIQDSLPVTFVFQMPVTIQPVRIR